MNKPRDFVSYFVFLFGNIVYLVQLGLFFIFEQVCILDHKRLEQ